jgi:hypothetical protein
MSVFDASPFDRQSPSGMPIWDSGNLDATRERTILSAVRHEQWPRSRVASYFILITAISVSSRSSPTSVVLWYKPGHPHEAARGAEVLISTYRPCSGI